MAEYVLCCVQVPLLEGGDIIIDGGNSEYTDTTVIFLNHSHDHPLINYYTISLTYFSSNREVICKILKKILAFLTVLNLFSASGSIGR